MTKCPQCGKDVSAFERDLFTGVCRTCRRVGARPASLGFGTLILIAIAVALVTNSMRDNVADIERDVSELRAAVERLERASALQLDEIRTLRQELEARGTGTTPRQ